MTSPIETAFWLKWGIAVATLAIGLPWYLIAAKRHHEREMEKLARKNDPRKSLPLVQIWMEESADISYDQWEKLKPPRGGGESGDGLGGGGHD